MITLINKLPAELIERILLEVAIRRDDSIKDDTSYDTSDTQLSESHHSSPISDHHTIYSSSVEYDSDGDEIYNNFNIVNHDVQALLDFRLTCRTFRDLSWRAFATALGETRFDLRSRKSVSNLIAISSCKYLARWITNLTIACHGTPEKYPYAYCEGSISDTVKHLDKALFHELLKVKKDEQTWYPGIWERWPEASLNEASSGNLPLERYQQVDIRLLEKVLASALRSFSNLNYLCYVYEPEKPPGRYHACNLLEQPERDYQSRFDLSFGSGRYAGYIAHVGLEILFRALASSGIAVRTMDLAVDLLEYHAFITHVPADIFTVASQKVEKLMLRDNYCPFFDDNEAGEEPRLAITNSIFPSLQHLVIDHNDSAPEFDHLVTPWPSNSDIPSLTSLRIVNSRTDRDSLRSFIQIYGLHLRQLAFQDMVYPDFNDLLKVIRTLDLQELRIHYEPKHRRPGDDPQLLFDSVPNTISNAAKTVIISPPSLKAEWKLAWKMLRSLTINED